MKRPVIDARLKEIRTGHLVHCGQDSCGALLGDIPPQDADWIMIAPDNTEVSAADGFSRREEDGHVIYSLIPPRWRRDSLGRTMLDHSGQPLARRGGRRPMRPEGASGPGSHRRILEGNAAILPALVDCPKCPRRNRVPVPELS